MQEFYPIRVIDLRFLVDHNTPKRIKLFEENRAAAENARLFVIFIKHRQIKMISHGFKNSQVEVI